MRINKFVASRVHSYLDFSIDFFPDLTFLTGINGSGKTTIVNGISALISPSLLMLANMDYERMEIHIEHEEKNVIIWSTRNEEQIIIGNSEVSESLKITVLPKEAFESIPLYKIREEKIKYYREQETFSSTHAVLKSIKSLPTPMFLDIERRIEDISSDRATTFAIRRRSQNIFSSSLSRSLLEAATLAEASYRRIQARQRELTDKLRKNIILSAVQYEDKKKNRLTFPDLGERYLEVKKDQVKTTLLLLGLSEKEVMQQLDPFFEKLKELSDLLPADKDILELTQETEDGEGDKGFTIESHLIVAISDWMSHKPQFDRIMMISNHADEYVKESKKLSEPITGYLDTVNKFLQDSGKKLGFDETGNLVVNQSKANACPITSLSSGESQIVVILTQLTFNPAAQRANVFVVDEPELSLHVRWQELFVESLKSAAPSLQIILATHSPSIILDDLDHCIDLSEGNRD